jgi:hypothetical protein
MMPINKVDVARRQAEAAIQMLFEERDSLAVATVVHAANEVLSSLTARHPKSIRALLLSWVVPGKTTEFWKAHNRLPNFLKHSSSDAQESMDEPADTYSDSLLAACCLMYNDLTGSNTRTMEAYLRWYSVLNPKVAGGRIGQVAASDAGDLVRELPRAEQLAWGRQLLATMLAA